MRQNKFDDFFDRHGITLGGSWMVLTILKLAGMLPYGWAYVFFVPILVYLIWLAIAYILAWIIVEGAEFLYAVFRDPTRNSYQCNNTNPMYWDETDKQFYTEDGPLVNEGWYFDKAKSQYVLILDGTVVGTYRTATHYNCY